MRLRSLQFLCALLIGWFSVLTLYSQTIEANNSQSPQAINSADILSIAISHTGGTPLAGHDWWIAVVTSLPSPNDIYYYDGTSWSTEFSVAFQQPLTEINSLELLNGSGLPPGNYVFYFGIDSIANGVLDTDSLVYDSISVVSEAAIAGNDQSCGNSRQIFSVDPLPSDAYFQIDPLGATNPSSHTFPTVHTYMMLQDSSQPREVYAPTDISISNISVIESLTAGGTDFSLNFTPCPEVTGYFDHLSAVSETLQNQLTGAGNCQQYVAGTDEYRFCSHSVSVEVAAGTILGSAGGGMGQNSAALDFGLRDSRTAPLWYANLERLVSSDQHHVVCPYDYYVPGPVKAGLVAKLGVARQNLPICGSVAHDVADTAQGRWYLLGSSDFGEADHLALVPSNKRPDDVGVLSVGNSELGTDAYFFDYTETGLVNRRFSEIGPGSAIYCWDTLRNRESSLASGNAQAISGILFLQLSDATHLKIQRSSQHGSCPATTDSLSFDNAGPQFER